MQLQVCFARDSEQLFLSYLLVETRISLKIIFKLILSYLANIVEIAVGRTRVCWTMAKLTWAGRTRISCDT